MHVTELRTVALIENQNNALFLNLVLGVLEGYDPVVVSRCLDDFFLKVPAPDFTEVLLLLRSTQPFPSAILRCCYSRA